MKKLFLKSLAFIIIFIAFLGCSPIKKHITLNSVSLISSKSIKEAYLKYPHVTHTRNAYNRCTQSPVYPKDKYNNQHMLLPNLFLAIDFSSKEKIFYDYAKEDRDKESKFPQYIFIGGTQNSPKGIRFCPILKSVKGKNYNYLYFYPTKSKDKHGLVHDVKGENNITFSIRRSGYMLTERAMYTNEIVISKEMLDKLELP